METWKETKNIKHYELMCPCCYRSDMSQSFIDRLQLARDILDAKRIKFVFISGFRCLIHNIAVGGSDDSAHIHGRGVDIKYKNSWECWEIVTALMKVGFKRIGINNGSIHVDDMDDESHPSPRMWNYYKK